MFVDLDWPLNASSLLSASAELLILYTLENINFSIFANYQLSCFIRCRQSVLRDFRSNFLDVLGQKRISTEWERQDMCGVKYLHGLSWIFRDGSLFSWIGKFFYASARCRRYSRYVAFVAICWNNRFIQSYGSRISLPYSMTVGCLYWPRAQQNENKSSK